MEGVYRSILRTSWHIVWQHKFLWFFGLFAALLGSTGEYEVILQHIDAYNFQQQLVQELSNREATGMLTLLWNGLVDAVSANMASAIGWSLLLIVLFVVAYALSVLSQGALIYTTGEANEQRSVSVDAAWHAGRRTFWKILVLSLFGKLINWVIFFAAGIPLGYAAYVTTQDDVWRLTLLLIAIFVFIPLSLVIAFTLRYAMAYATLRKTNLRDALAHGFLLFARNWVVSAEMALILLLVNIVAGVILVLGVVAIAVPFLVFGLLVSAMGAVPVINIIAVLGIAVIAVWILASGSVVAAYQWTSWITLFGYLENGKVKSKLARVIDRLPSYIGRKQIQA